MSLLKEENLINILPKDGPTLQETIKYLEKYNDEFIVIKCGGSVLVDPRLFKIFIEDVAVLNKLKVVILSLLLHHHDNLKVSPR